MFCDQATCAGFDAAPGTTRIDCGSSRGVRSTGNPPNRAIGGKGTFTPQRRQPCRLLLNDGKRRDEVLGAVMVKRKNRAHRRSGHLCADAGYRSADNLCAIETHGCNPHVVDRRKEADIKRHAPKKWPGAGLSRSAIAGTAAFESCSCDRRS